MDPEEPIDPVDRIALPPRFHSEETGEPFESCIECSLPLGATGDGYIIQKCTNGRETIFEFALCMTCGESLHESYSEKSRRAIEGFFQDHIDIEKRYDDTWLLDLPELADHFLQHCLTCGDAPKPGDPVTHAAVCEGSEMLVGHSPICLCSKCEAALNELVSKETRDEWDKFIGRNFDLPPSDALNPDTGKPVLVL